MISTYESDAVSVPPYLNYIPIKRNILAENDRSLKYYPYFGEDTVGIKSGLEKELEDRFNDRIKDLPLRHFYAEQADKLEPYAVRYLEDVGCQITDILYLLLDPSGPKEPDEPSSASNMAKWQNQCFATESGRANKKWRELFCHLKRPDQQALTRADLACRSFYNVTELSLWYIVKNHGIVTALFNEISARKDTPTSRDDASPYTTLGCLICHV